MQIRQTSYVKKALMTGEEVLVEGYLHWVHRIWAWVSGGMGGILLILSAWQPALLLLSLPCLVWALYIHLKVEGTQMLVTNRRVIMKSGIISIHTEELKSIKVESIEIDQPIMGRILGYATIHFTGTGASDVYFTDVADPWELKKAIEMAIDNTNA